MYFLAVEIHNIRQLVRLRPAAMASIERSLDGLAASRGLTPFLHDGGIYLYTFEHVASGDLASLAAAAWSVLCLLRERGDDLMGFLIYLDSFEHLDSFDSPGSEDVLNDIHRALQSAAVEDSLIVGASAEESMAGLFVLDNEGAQRTVTGLGEGRPPKLTELARFVRHPSLYEPILAELERFYFESTEPGVVLVHGPRFSGKSQNLAEAIRRLLGPERSLGLLRLYPSSTSDSPLAPFINGLRAADLETVPAYLTRIEKAIWDNLREMMVALLGFHGASETAQESNDADRAPAGNAGAPSSGSAGVAELRRPAHPVVSDGAATDLLIVYGLVLKAIIRMAEENLSPAVVLLENVHNYAKESLEIAAGVLREYIYGGRLLPILVSHKPYLPAELREFSFSKHRVPALDYGIISELVNEFMDGDPAGLVIRSSLQERTGGRIVSLFHHLRAVQNRRDRPGSVPEREPERGSESLPDIHPESPPDTRSEHRQDGAPGDSRAGSANDKPAGSANVSPNGAPRTRGADAGAPDGSEQVAKDGAFPGLEAVWESVRCLEPGEQQILYAVHISSELFDVGTIGRVVEAVDVPALRVPKIVSNLAELGLLYIDDRLRPAVPELEPRLEGALGGSGRVLRETVARSLYAAWRERSVTNSRSLFERVYDAGLLDEAIEVFRDLVSGLLARREYGEVSRLLYQECPLDDQRGSPGQSRELRMTLLALRLGLALHTFDRNSANEAYRDSREPGLVAEKSKAEADLVLQQAAYLAAGGDFAGGIRLAKRAIMLYQDESNLVGLTSSHTEFGLMMVGQGDVAQARDYFVIALGSVSSDRNPYEYVRAAAMEAVSLFLLGNYSRVLELLDALERISERTGMRWWNAYLLHLRARTLFDLGKYAECDVHLQRCLSFAELYRLEAPRSVFAAWAGRVHVYLNEFETAHRLLSGVPERSESLLFLAELHERNGQIDRSLECLERALALPSPPAFVPREVPSWTDGFADIEGLAVRHSDESVLHRLIRAFHGYALAKHGDVRGGVSELYALTRKDGLSPVDPYNSIYFYLYSAILPATQDEGRDSSMEDRLTVLGKSVKHLQERSSRIDDHSHKSAFLHESYWNALLYDEARSHNLV